MTPIRCPACDLPVPADSRSAGWTYCTVACREGAAAVQRLRGRLRAAAVAGDNGGAQIEREHLMVTVSWIRLQRARNLGRKPSLKVSPGRLR